MLLACSLTLLCSRAISVRVIFSTDSAGGLSASVGGCQHCNVSNPYSFQSVVDLDDSLALTMALNSPDIQLGAVLVTYGNADLWGEMLSTEYLVRQLKGEMNVPVLAGARSSVSSQLSPLPRFTFAQAQWDTLSAFRSACDNQGVSFIAQSLQSAPAHLLAIGPLTDLACLLENHPAAIPNILSIVVLGSQPSDSPMDLDNMTGKLVDFNIWNDPLAATIVLGHANETKIVLMNWNLTRLGSVKGQNIEFNNETVRPPAGTDPASTHWIWDIALARPDWPTGLPEGPFDQYVLQYVLDPTVFECDMFPVYMQQCEDPQMSRCTGHGVNQSDFMSSEVAQMLVDFSSTYQGPLVAGQGYLSSLPTLQAPKLTVCHNYAANGRQRFVETLFNLTW